MGDPAAVSASNSSAVAIAAIDTSDSHWADSELVARPGATMRQQLDDCRHGHSPGGRFDAGAGAALLSQCLEQQQAGGSAADLCSAAETNACPNAQQHAIGPTTNDNARYPHTITRIMAHHCQILPIADVEVQPLVGKLVEIQRVSILMTSVCEELGHGNAVRDQR